MTTAEVGPMQYTVICPSKRCAERYTPTGDQLVWIVEAAKKGMTFIVINCDCCGVSLFFNPQHPEGLLEPPGPTLLCCPVEACSSGLVVALADPSAAYQCGECANEWTSKAELDDAICAIIAKYPYRAACYIKTGAGWSPVEYEKIPEDYHQMVDGEAPPADS